MSSNMFNNISNMEIYDSVLVMENHMKEDLERLHPSHKADYKTVLGAQVLKREECTAGTRVKILEDITKWANDSSPRSPRVFWLTGQAGSGKTTIAYTITKRFGKNGTTDVPFTILGGNFLCSRQFEETREGTRIVPTIAYHLARKCKRYARALHDSQNFDAVHHDVPTQLRDLLIGPWQQSTRNRQLQPYLIVIDALDEIKDGGGSAFLQELLTVIDEYDMRGFKFLVTSRPDPEVVTLCESFTSDAVCWLQDVPFDEAESDIRTYLKAKLPKLAGSSELAELVRQADGLFIYAATAVKHLTPHRSITAREQTEMLKHLVSKSHRPAYANDSTFLIDALYRQIMVDAFSKFKDKFLSRRLGILYTFLCTAERTSTSIAAALAAEGDDDVAVAVVEELHAVLYTQGDRIYWYHASFPDFIFDATRSNFDNLTFWCDEPAHQNVLGESCFRVMKTGLRFNMGDIESSFLFDSDNGEELSEKVNNNISAVLRYSACHWGHHLPSPLLVNADNLRICISEFLEIRVLFWIEAMNLLGSRNRCTPMLQHAREWVLKSGNNYSELARDIGEAANFATYFTGSPAAESTPHLYISALATWSQDTELCRKWKSQFSRIPAFTHTKGRIDVPLMTIRCGIGIGAVVISRDGTRIVSGSGDNTVYVWDASTGANLNKLMGHTKHINSVAISRDGMWIASGSNDTTVRIWDTSTGAELHALIGHTEQVKSVAISRDGTWIVSGSADKTVRIWGVPEAAELHVLIGHTNRVRSVAISRDGMWIVSGSADKTVRIWDVPAAAELHVLRGHTDWVNSVAISKDSMWIVSGSCDRTVRIWDMSTGAELNVLRGHTLNVKSVMFSRDDMRIVSGSNDMTVRIWDVSTGAELNVLNGHTNSVNSVVFSGDGTRIVSGSYDETVRVWNVFTDAELITHVGHTDWVSSVAISKDGTRIVSGSYDNTVRIWEASTGAEVNAFMAHTGAVNCFAISKDGRWIASGSYDRTVRIWDASTCAELNVLIGHTESVNSLAISRNSRRIVSGSFDQTVRIWDAFTGAELNVLRGHTDVVNSVAISRDSTWIVSGSDDHTVRIWDVPTGAEFNVLEGHTDSVNSIAVTRNGRRIVSGSDDMNVRIWEASTGAELNVLEGHTDSINSVVVSRDGTRIVSGSDDKTVRVWDAFTGAELNVFMGHSGMVRSVALSRDDVWIVSGSDDDSVRMWGISTGADLDVPQCHPDSPHSVAYPRQCLWHLTQTNWIVSSQANRLMWVPQEAQVIEPSFTLVISRRGFGSVDFRQARMGVEWIGCHTP